MTQTGRAGAGPEDDGLEDPGGETAGLLTSQRAEQGDPTRPTLMPTPRAASRVFGWALRRGLAAASGWVWLGAGEYAWRLSARLVAGHDSWACANKPFLSVRQ